MIGPPSVWGLDGPGWPDEPLWKLSGLFDRTFDESVRGGVTILEDAMAAHPNEALVIFGYSQGAVIANIEKQKLAEQYPKGTEAPRHRLRAERRPQSSQRRPCRPVPWPLLPILD